MPRKNPGESKEEPTRKLVQLPKRRIGSISKKIDSKAGERREAGPAIPKVPYKYIMKKPAKK